MNIRTAEPVDRDALMKLYHYLSPRYKDNPRALSEVQSRLKDTFVFIGETEGFVVCTATLSIRGVPSAGLVAHIDDVVTDPEFRGRGFGRMLIDYCITKARKKKCVRIELTSHQSRKEANSLYLKMGFELRETNNYVMKFNRPQSPGDFKIL